MFLLYLGLEEMELMIVQMTVNATGKCMLKVRSIQNRKK